MIRILPRFSLPRPVRRGLAALGLGVALAATSLHGEARAQDAIAAVRPDYAHALRDGVPLVFIKARGWSPKKDGAFQAGGLVALGATKQGLSYALDATGKIWSIAGDKTVQVPGLLKDLSPVSSSVLWGVEPKGTLVRTSNAGAKWEPLGPGWSKVSAVDASVAWALRTDGTVALSTDGGASWQNAQGVKAARISAPTDEDAWVVTARGEGLRSIDAGTSWDPVALPADGSGKWLQISAEGSRSALGLSGGRKLFRTDDGGRTWTAMATPGAAQVATAPVTKDAASKAAPSADPAPVDATKGAVAAKDQSGAQFADMDDDDKNPFDDDADATTKPVVAADAAGKVVKEMKPDVKADVDPVADAVQPVDVVKPADKVKTVDKAKTVDATKTADKAKTKTADTAKSVDTAKAADETKAADEAVVVDPKKATTNTSGFTEQDRAAFRSADISGARTAQPSSLRSAIVPKGAEVARIVLFGDQVLKGFQLSYRTDPSGPLVESEIVGTADKARKSLDLAPDEQLVIASASWVDGATQSLKVETDQFRSISVGAASATAKSASVVLMGRLVSLTAEVGPAGLGRIIATFYADTPLAEAQMAYLSNPDPMMDPKLLGFAPDAVASFGREAGTRRVGMNYNFQLLIPKESELAQIVFYSDDYIRGIQLGFREPGEKRIYMTSIVGEPLGTRRGMSFADQEFLVRADAKWYPGRGIEGVILQKSTGQRVGYGRLDDPSTAARSGVVYEVPSKEFGFAGFKGTTEDVQGIGRTFALLGAVQASEIVGTKLEESAGLPSAINTGCRVDPANDTAKSSGASSPPKRPPGKSVEQVFFAAQASDDNAPGLASSGAALPKGCLFNIDGIWATNAVIALKNSPPIPGSMETIDGTGGNYSGRQFIVISSSADADNQIAIQDGLGDGGETFFNSSDPGGPSLRDLLVNRVPNSSKVYKNGSRTLTIYIEQSGTITIVLEDSNHPDEELRFQRPSYVVVPKPDPKKIESDDPYLATANFEDIKPIRRGYDITTQNPFNLVLNTGATSAQRAKRAAEGFPTADAGALAELFEKADPRQYKMEGRSIVPVGVLYFKDGDYLKNVTETIITSEREFQKSITNAFGANVGYGQQPDNKGTKSDGGSIGVDYSQTESKGFKDGSTTSLLMGTARFKSYALVIDHPYAKLTTGFVDALYRAARTRNFKKEIIDVYGTHYAYAVTFGSGVVFKEVFDQESHAEWAGTSSDLSVQGSATYKGVTAEAKYSQKQEESSKQDKTQSFRQTNSRGMCTTNNDAAGSGSDCPVLVDLRPLDDLVSPVYFPGQTEWITSVKGQLRNAIQAYLDGKSNLLSDQRNLPEVWQISLDSITCTDKGYADSSVEGWVNLEGDIDLQATFPTIKNGQPVNVTKSVKAFSYPKGAGLKFKCDSKPKALANLPLTLFGTKDQLLKANVELKMTELTEIDLGNLVDPDDILGGVDGTPKMMGVPFARTWKDMLDNAQSYLKTGEPKIPDFISLTQPELYKAMMQSIANNPAGYKDFPAGFSTKHTTKVQEKESDPALEYNFSYKRIR